MYLLLDIFPILSLLYIHHRNFSYVPDREGTSIHSSRSSKIDNGVHTAEKEKTLTTLSDKDGNLQVDDD
jgi:hypothetical protein